MRVPGISRIAAIACVAFAFAIACGSTGPAQTELTPEWNVAAELARPRAYARAITVATGEVLIVGGLDPDDPAVTNPTTELFDPAAGTVATLPQRILGRLNQSVTIGWGERVVVAGGTMWAGDHWDPVDRTDVYIPWSRTWLKASPMLEPRSSHAATALPDGRILVTGGNATGLLRGSEIYDPARDVWMPAAPLPKARTGHSAATLLNGRVLVVGGFERDGTPSRTTYIYDPPSDSWSSGPNLIIERRNHTMAMLPNGDVLIFGGERSAGGTAERFDVRRRVFEHAGTLAEPRLVAQGAVLPDGRVIAVGGMSNERYPRGFRPLSDAELWDPTTETWHELADAPTPRVYATLVVTDRGVFRISGIGVDQRLFATIERLVWH